MPSARSEQQQLYTLVGTGSQHQMDSIVHIHLDDDERITKHSDWFLQVDSF